MWPTPTVYIIYELINSNESRSMNKKCFETRKSVERVYTPAILKVIVICVYGMPNVVDVLSFNPYRRQHLFFFVAICRYIR